MALRYMYASGLFQAYLLLRYASGLFQAYLLFLSLFSPFIPKLLKGAIFRPKNIFTRLLLPPQKLAALGGRLVRLVVKPVLYKNPSGVVIRPDNTKHKHRWSGQCCDWFS